MFGVRSNGCSADFGDVLPMDVELKAALQEYLSRQGVPLSSDVRLKFNVVDGVSGFSCYAVAAIPEQDVVSAPLQKIMFRDNAKLQEYKQYTDAVKEDGYCYLAIIKHKHRPMFKKKLGPNPNFIKLISTLDDKVFNVHTAGTFHVVRKHNEMSNNLHLTSAYVTDQYHDYGTFFQVMLATARRYDVPLFRAFSGADHNYVHSVSTYNLLGAKSSDSSVSSLSTNSSHTNILGNISDLDDLDIYQRELETAYTTQCTCEAHGVLVGKCKSSAKSVVVAASRIADKFQSVISPALSFERKFKDTFVAFRNGSITRKQADAVLAIRKPPKSSVTWGLGYSYLSAISSRYRDLVATVLGSYPLLYDVHVMIKFVSSDRCTYVALELIDLLHCHFVDDEKKLVVVFDEVVSTIIERFPNITVV